MSELTELLDAVDVEWNLADHPVPEGFPHDSSAWTIVVRRGERTFETRYFTGPAAGEPEKDQVLYALASDAENGLQTFEDFCDDLGYDSDSRRAYAIWEACRENGRRLAEIFTTDERDLLREIDA